MTGLPGNFDIFSSSPARWSIEKPSNMDVSLADDQILTTNNQLTRQGCPQVERVCAKLFRSCFYSHTSILIISCFEKERKKNVTVH